jgi:hypothetical protein
MINNKNVPLIAVHKARYFADKDEKLSLGPGGFVSGKHLGWYKGNEENVITVLF